MEELAATINEISVQVKETADYAKDARYRSDMTEEQILASNRQMQEMIASIGEISEKSGQIGKIINSIFSQPFCFPWLKPEQETR